MEDKEIILEQYRIYTDAKERYIDRAFLVNRFFIVAVGLMFLVLLGTKTFFSMGYGFSMAGEILGMAMCIMWFSNQDAYSSIIGIKYNAAIEKMEEFLPVSPVKDEYEELQKLRAKRKVILVKDIQKWFAIVVLMIFIANFLMDFGDWIIFSFFNA